MFFIAFRVAAIAAGAASAVAASQESERKRLGLPPPPPKSAEEIARLDKLSREGENMMIAWIMFEAVLFASVITMAIYLLIRIVFAAKGIKLP